MIGNYYVVLRKNGSRQAVGYLGPYSSRSGALTDASALKREGLTVEVTTEPPESLVGVHSNPVPAVAATGATAVRTVLAHPRTKQLLVQVALPYIKDRVVGGLSEFQKATEAEQIEALRKLAERIPALQGGYALRKLLKSDKRAAAVAGLLSSKESIQAMTAAVNQAGKPAKK